jgi:hypothetical protein
MLEEQSTAARTGAEQSPRIFHGSLCRFRVSFGIVVSLDDSGSAEKLNKSML